MYDFAKGGFWPFFVGSSFLLVIGMVVLDILSFFIKLKENYAMITL